jgi:glutamine synthetase type III
MGQGEFFGEIPDRVASRIDGIDGELKALGKTMEIRAV